MIVGTAGRGPSSIAELLDPALAARLESLDVVSRKVFSGKLQGERRSKRRGRSVEFDDYREYVPGDDLRHIDWNVFARLDRFFIKVFQEEEDLCLHLVIDASASMLAGVPTKLLCAARIAAALGYIGLVKNNRVRVSLIGDGRAAGDVPARALRQLSPLRGRASVQRLAAYLVDELFAPLPEATGDAPARARGTPAEAFADACRTIVAAGAGGGGGGGGRGGKGVLVLLSDLLIPGAGDYRGGLKLLTAAGASGGGFDTVVLQVLSPGEIDPARERRAPPRHRGDEDAEPEADAARPGLISGDLRLTDVETGREAEITATPEVIERYRRSVRRYVDEAAAFCAARGCTHALVPSDTDAGDLVLGVLRRRGVVG